ncbi:MAG: hemolysin family protein [Deltaproteobacteria bacterium]|nr:hemolysin family protein [Deltaproteobacteria bacterium]
MIYLLTVIGVVIFTSAVCSLFEAVLYSVPLSHIESLLHSGRPSGRALSQLRKNVDRPIAAILFLNTIANTGGAAFAGAIAAEVLGNASLAYFSAAFTLAILMFSEILPKTAGVAYARPLARFIALPLQFMVWIFTPIIWMSRFVTRLVSGRGETHRVTDEDLLVMVRLGLRSGDFKEHEAEVIQNILELEAKKASDVMTPRSVVYTLSADLTVGDVRHEEKLLNYSRIPIYDQGAEDIVGIVHRREVLTAIANDRFTVKLRELMGPAHFVLETTPLDKLLRLFLERRQHMVIVIGEYGVLSGITTLEDVLEEIIGHEIVDEFDQVTDLQEFARRQRSEILGRQGARPVPKG